MQQAWQLFKSGHTNEALKVAEAICNSDKIDADSTYFYGCCLSQLGRHSDALNSFNQSLLYQPGSIDVYIAIGYSLVAQNNVEEAAKYFEKVLFTEPSHLLARVELAKCLAASDKNEAARKELQNASKFNLDSGLPHCELAKLGQQVNDPIEDIYQHCLTAVNLEPGIAEYVYELGKCLFMQERYDEANHYLDKAYKIDAVNPAILAAFIAVSVKLGNMDFAFEQIDKLQKRNIFIPFVALSFLMCCKHGDRCDEAIGYAQTCLNDENLSEDDRRNIHSKLASVLDYKQQYDQAWQHMVASKKRQTSMDHYDPIRHKAYIDNLIETFNFANLFKLPRANITQNRSPIFIIGMPRSGTSLVEQILAAHPEVTGGGELNYIQNIIYDLPKLTGSPQAWPFCVLDVKQQLSNELASRYLDRISRLSESTQYVTDKMPHNFYYIGLIKLLFPKAKIIHCQRHPLDTCISICFQNFKEGHEYSDNLFNLGAHYHQYQRIKKHWQSSLSIEMFEMKYEELVENPQQSISKMLNFCNLDWDDNCLNFNKLERHVITASFDQVRQPLYTHSVNRWKHYEAYLDELHEGLSRGF